jgi:hypothetical protein
VVLESALDSPAPRGGTQPFDRVLSVLAGPALGRPLRGWWRCFSLAVTALGLGVIAVAYQLRTGIGTWGLNNSVGWAYDITNFVFWIGVGHAGTLISAILLLFRQRWRTSAAPPSR